jgi:type II secretory pathway component GspD/PulD (secretin)
VQIDVQTTNSSISSSSVQINADATVPIINERRASTMVSVQSGQTVVIGGLISASEDSREKKMPLLGSIPLLGNLFKNSKNVSDRKELLVLLTPQILTATPEDQWSENIKSFSDDMIRESSMKNVFKDDEKKRAMFERVFPTDVKPEEGSVEPKKPQEEVKPPGE